MAEKVKKINSKIITIHYVAPQVWVWREGRIKKMKKFIDHVLLLFNFEKKYFEKEQLSCEFVGHPLLDQKQKSKIDINQIIGKNKALISIFAGSRKSEIITLTPILLNFVRLMNKKYNDMTYVFHSTKENSELTLSLIKDSNLQNCEVVSDDIIKSHILKKSIFAVAKSGTVSLEICNAKIPLIIIYKMNFINYLIVKSLVKIRFANIINISANKEIIPELLQSKCNAKNIYKYVESYLDEPIKIKEQVEKVQSILKDFRTNQSSSKLASISLNKFLQ